MAGRLGGAEDGLACCLLTVPELLLLPLFTPRVTGFICGCQLAIKIAPCVKTTQNAFEWPCPSLHSAPPMGHVLHHTDTGSVVGVSIGLTRAEPLHTRVQLIGMAASSRFSDFVPVATGV